MANASQSIGFTHIEVLYMGKVGEDQHGGFAYRMCGTWDCGPFPMGFQWETQELLCSVGASGECRSVRVLVLWMGKTGKTKHERSHDLDEITALFPWAFDGRRDNCCVRQIGVAKHHGKRRLRYRLGSGRRELARTVLKDRYEYGPFTVGNQWFLREFLCSASRCGKTPWRYINIQLEGENRRTGSLRKCTKDSGFRPYYFEFSMRIAEVAAYGRYRCPPCAGRVSPRVSEHAVAPMNVVNRRRGWRNTALFQ